MMKKLNPLFCAVTLALSASVANASVTNFISDSTLDAKARTIYYDMEGDYNKTVNVPGAMFGLPVPSVAVNYQNEMSIKDLGASLWLNWQSGLLFNIVGVELGYQGAVISHQNGVNNLTETTGAFGGLADFSAANVQFYQGDADSNSVGKLANANIRVRLGDDDNNLQMKVGRFTPTIFDLLHRPEVTFYALSSLYQGAQLTADLKWEWGKINPWFNYFTGFSSEHSKEMVHFKDLNSNAQYDAFDAIYNAGFHTETDYFTASASYSYARDYLSNGIIEVYSGIPLSMIGFSTNDDDYYIKYMVKYGMEKGLGTVNQDHSTDVTEFAVGMQAGELDFLAGVTQIGDGTFRGFETQDGHNAGGGTAVWGDMAMLNTFKYAGQKTLFLVGGYNLNIFNLPNWRIQGTVASGSGIDLTKLSAGESFMVNQEDFTETEIDLVYSQNGYQGEGVSVRLTYGQDDNFNAKGVGLWVEYNGDILKAFD